MTKAGPLPTAGTELLLHAKPPQRRTPQIATVPRSPFCSFSIPEVQRNRGRTALIRRENCWQMAFDTERQTRVWTER